MKVFDTSITFLILLFYVFAEKYPGQSKDLKDPLQKSNVLTAENYNMTQADQDLILQRHNYYRGLHENTDKLIWNDTLASYAASFVAAYDCASGELKHSLWEFGENIALGYNVKGSVKGWYDEIKDYDYSKAEFTTAAGHFTQLIWKETKQVGCALRYCNSYWGNITVCEYDPAGNWDGEFEENIQPLVIKPRPKKNLRENPVINSNTKANNELPSLSQNNMKDRPMTITFTPHSASTKSIFDNMQVYSSTTPLVVYKGLAISLKPTYLFYIVFSIIYLI